MKPYVPIILSILLLLSSISIADEPVFSKMPKDKPQLIQNGPDKGWCPVCGMSLKMFYKTSHGAVLKDGHQKQYCSLRCLTVDYPSIKQNLGKMLVVDLKTEKLIDVQKAHYVIGSKVPGTMTKKSKLAFSEKAAAKVFHEKMGGTLGTFDTAFSDAQASLQTDIAMTDKKRKTKMYPMGEKIFSAMCSQDIDPSTFNRINTLKAHITQNNLCKPLKEKQLQAVALYLWDIKRFEGSGETSHETLKVTKDEKCPVCGMFVYKYPRWVAKLFTTSGKEGHHESFDGVKDMIKFYLNPAKWGALPGQTFEKVMVTDYYSQKGINGKTAYYVIGSNVYGPMGKELIPFATKQQAQTFANDHLGKKIVTFDEITQELITALDK